MLKNGGKKTLENLEEGLAWDNTVITDLSQNFDQLCSSLGPRQTCGLYGDTPIVKFPVFVVLKAESIAMET